MLLSVVMVASLAACSFDTAATISKNGSVKLISTSILPKNDTTEEYVDIIKEAGGNVEEVKLDGGETVQYRITETQDLQSNADFEKLLTGKVEIDGADDEIGISDLSGNIGIFSTATVSTKVMYGRVSTEFTEGINALLDSEVNISYTFSLTFPYKIVNTNLPVIDDYTVNFNISDVEGKNIYVMTEKTNYESLFKKLNNYAIMPSNFQVKTMKLQNNNQVYLSWTPSTNAKNYNVYARVAGSKDYETFDMTSGTSATIYDLEPGKSYRFKITAANAEGKTVNAYSDFIKTLSKNSLGVTAQKKAAKLSWKKDSAASGYQIYMKEGSGSYKLIKTVSSNSTVSYTKSALTGGKKYTFRIRSYKVVSGKNVYGDYSSSKTVTVKK